VIKRRDIELSVEVAKVTEIPVGRMKRVTVFDENILLSLPNVGGKFYATQNDCGHQRASLARGKLEGSVVTCPLVEFPFVTLPVRHRRGCVDHGVASPDF
jgi:nitrite reductase/ring-hydroxylating ferredoxin subunit